MIELVRRMHTVLAVACDACIPTVEAGNVQDEAKGNRVAAILSRSGMLFVSLLLIVFYMKYNFCEIDLWTGSGDVLHGKRKWPLVYYGVASCSIVINLLCVRPGTGNGLSCHL